MVEIEQLREQITDLVNGLEVADRVDVNLRVAPTARQETVLRQILCASYLDQVARLEVAGRGRGPSPGPAVSSSSSNQAAVATACKRVSKLDRYCTFAAGSDPGFAGEGADHQSEQQHQQLNFDPGEAYIHPSSAVHQLPPAPSSAAAGGLDSSIQASLSSSRRSRRLLSGGFAPPFIVYAEFVRSRKRPWLKMVTTVDASWLSALGPHLCTFSGPVTTPAPGYDRDTDSVRCYVRPAYGVSRAWPLPLAKVEYPVPSPVAVGARAKLFARALLEGHVISGMAAWSDRLLSPPSLIDKPYVQRKVINLVQTLVQSNVCSAASLRVLWQTRPQFLLAEILAWVPQELASQFKKYWSAMVRSEYANSTTTTTPTN